MLYLNRVVNDLLSVKGVLVYDRRVLCHTLELPWLNNSKSLSCIPAGVYDLVHSNSSNFGRCLRIPSVIGRSGILIHAGNTIKDTRGCILVGLDVNDVGVLHSKLALKRLLDTLPEQTKLTIRNI